MNYKFKTIPLFLAGLALAMTGCKDDMIGDTDSTLSEYDGTYYYVTAGISLPSDGTRSGTDDGPSGDGDDKTNSDGTANGTGGGKDYEYGYDYENEIRTMLLVYSTPEGEYIASSKVTGITKAPTTAQPFDLIVTAEIKHSDLEAAYKDGPLKDGDKSVNIYAICNYTSRLQDLFEYGADADGNPAYGGNGSFENWRDWSGTVEEESSPAGHTPIMSNTIWAQRSFLMTNWETNKVTFPSDISVWDENYSDRDQPFDCTVDAQGNATPIKVERAAARIDFKDGSPSPSTAPNTYPLILDTGTAQMNLISVELTRMALVNMSKNFFYFRRVSDSGTNTGWVVGGREKKTPNFNYVVDTDYAKKLLANGAGYNAENATEGFNFPLYTTDEAYNMDAWYVDDIKDVVKQGNTMDNWGTTPSYYIWRYVTENTIPSVDQQKTIQSTGVVFKGKIKKGTQTEQDANRKYIAQEVYDALDKLDQIGTGDIGSYVPPTLYSYENRLFANFTGIINAAIAEGTSSPLCNVVDGVLGNWIKKNGETVYKYAPGQQLATGDKKLTVAIYNAIQKGEDTSTIDLGDGNNQLNDLTFKSFAPANDITVYVADNNDGKGWGYYCYYFYWNRHNDNLKSGKMGVMEFATVRNNVYKLAVTAIGRLGHPRNVEDDPDPETPETPDEDPTNYIRVQVEVLPWVVRVNNITF